MGKRQQDTDDSYSVVLLSKFISSLPDFYRRSRIFTLSAPFGVSRLPFTVTAGMESHPSPKINFYFLINSGGRFRPPPKTKVLFKIMQESWKQRLNQQFFRLHE
jgi:hypothetical protein